jgi:hypothetical protein
MPRAFNKMKLCFGPNLVEGISVASGTRHVVTTVYNGPWDALQLARIAEQLPLLQPAAVHEIMGFQPREGESIIVNKEAVRKSRVGQKRNRLPLPVAPCLRRCQLSDRIVAGENVMVSRQHIAATRRSDGRQKFLPFVRKHF